MADTFVISGLRAKRAELDGELREAEKRAIVLRADLDAIDRALLVFDPFAKPKAIKPKQVRSGGAGRRTGITRTVLGVLHRADASMTAREIALAVAPQLSIDVSTNKLANSMVRRVRSTLNRVRGLVSEADGEVVRWRVE